MSPLYKKFYKKFNSFHDIVQATFYLQYLTISFPTYHITDDKVLIFKNKTSWLELGVIFVLVILNIYYTILNDELAFEFTIINIFLWILNYYTIIFSIISGWELRRKADLMISIFEDIKNFEEIAKLKKKQLNRLKTRVKIWSFGIVIAVITTITATIWQIESFKQCVVFTFAILRINVHPVVIMIQFFTLASFIEFHLEWIQEELTAMSLKYMEKGCNLQAPFRINLSRDYHDCKIVEKVEKIRKLYSNINDLKNNINQVYSLRLWMDTVNTILYILFFIYCNLIALKKNNGVLDQASILKFHYLIFWISFLTLKFLQNVSICGKVAECGRNVGVTVHRIYSRVYCDAVRSELTTFSLELLHRDPYIKAYRLFNIDYPLIASVVQGLIMQLIALTQINIPAISDDKDIYEILASDSDKHQMNHTKFHMNHNHTY